MLGIASFVLRGPGRAALVAAPSMLLGFILFPVTWISGATIGVVFLRKGLVPGLQTLLLASAAVAALGMVSLGKPAMVAVFAASVWFPVVLAAGVLRATVSLALSVLSIAALAALLVIMAALFAGDLTAQWAQLVEQFLTLSQFEERIELASVDRQLLIDEVARHMTGGLAATMFLSTCASLFLARWWQATLFNPGGFKQEFYALRLGKWAALVGIVLGLSIVLLRADLLDNLGWVAVALFAVQGVAVIHAVVALKGLHRAWLVGLYLSMILFLPQFIFAFALLGLIDPWLNVRERIGQPS